QRRSIFFVLLGRVVQKGRTAKRFPRGFNLESRTLNQITPDHAVTPAPSRSQAEVSKLRVFPVRNVRTIRLPRSSCSCAVIHARLARDDAPTSRDPGNPSAIQWDYEVFHSHPVESLPFLGIAQGRIAARLK